MELTDVEREDMIRQVAEESGEDPDIVREFVEAVWCCMDEDEL
jgi:hypothetical protein